MYPRVRRDFTLLRELDHMHGRRMSGCPARPAFQRRLKFPDRRIARASDGIERQTGARLTTLALDLKPAVAAVEALRDGRRGLGRAAEAFHLFRPQQTLGGIGLTGGFLGPLAGMLGTDFRAPHPITKNAPSGWSAHRDITAALAAAGNATRI
jgi:hypothetical protein